MVAGDQYYHCTLLDWTDGYYRALILHCSPPVTYRTTFIVSSPHSPPSHCLAAHQGRHLLSLLSLLLSALKMLLCLKMVLLEVLEVIQLVVWPVPAWCVLWPSLGHWCLLARLSWYAQQSNLSQFL